MVTPHILTRIASAAVLAAALFLYPIAASAADDAGKPIAGGACNAAKGCLLHQDPPSSAEYVCLPPRNECEANYLAGGCSREACEATAGCSFVPGHCFCPGGVQCVCGGGPPPGCVPE
jgi:hypothetical protein